MLIGPLWALNGDQGARSALLDSFPLHLPGPEFLAEGAVVVNQCPLRRSGIAARFISINGRNVPFFIALTLRCAAIMSW